MVNLIVDLSGERFDLGATAAHEQALEAGGFQVTREDRPHDGLLAWIDQTFGGAWSSEVFAGKSIAVKKDDAFAGFAGYGARGLRYGWLRAWHDRNDTGIFGPFGVEGRFRRAGLGSHVLMLALGALRQGGYARALIPAVGGDDLIRYYMRVSGATIAEEFDVAQLMQKKSRTTVLASGNGTNFQAVIDAVADTALGLDLAALVTNNGSAYALNRAERSGIPARIAFEWDRKTQSRQTYDSALLDAVLQTVPELVLLLGWMHLLSGEFVAAFPQMINIHPGFLPHDQSKDAVGMPDGSQIPAFRGAHAVRDALACGSSWVGATAHRVTIGTDRGPVLVRKPLAIASGWTQKRVMEHLQPMEHSVLLSGIRRWLMEREGEIRIG